MALFGLRRDPLRRVTSVLAETGTSPKGEDLRYVGQVTAANGGTGDSGPRSAAGNRNVVGLTTPADTLSTLAAGTPDLW
jgi:hypothetical protein